MDAAEKLEKTFLLLIQRKKAKASVLANFQLLEELLFKDEVGIQNSLSVSLKNQKMPGNSSEVLQNVSLS